MGEQGATRYRIVVHGFRAQRAESLADVLVRVLGLPTTRAQELADSVPCAVGSTAHLEHARHYAAELTKAGADLRLEPPLPDVEPESSRVGYTLGELALPQSVAPAKPFASDRAPAQESARPNSAPRLDLARPQHGYGGLRDLGESLAALAPGPAPTLEVDPDALRAIRPDTGTSREAKPRPTLGLRLARLLQTAAHRAAPMLSGALAFLVVVAITAAAVSYALDPDHVLDEVAFTRAKQSGQDLAAQLTGVLSRMFPAR